MWGSEVKPHNAWPKVRRIKPGVFRVKGRVVPVLAWLLVRRLAGVIALFACLWLLGAALLPWLVGFPDMFGPSNPVRWIVGTMMEFRFFLRNVLTEQYPGAGRAIYYTGLNPYDWHLLVVFVIAYRLRKLMGFFIARVLIIGLWPLLSRGFKITFTREFVVVHGWLRNRKLRRGGMVDHVAFISAPPQAQPGIVGRLVRAGYLKTGPEGDYFMALVLVANRPIKIALPRLMIDTDRIVQSCKLALDASRR